MSDDFDPLTEERTRNFTINLEGGIARRFIRACQRRGVFVRETLRDFMLGFAEDSEEEDDDCNFNTEENNR